MLCGILILGVQLKINDMTWKLVYKPIYNVYDTVFEESDGKQTENYYMVFLASLLYIYLKINFNYSNLTSLSNELNFSYLDFPQSIFIF